VSSADDLEFGILLSRFGHGVDDLFFGLAPRLVEALCGLAVGADVCVDDGEVDVGEPVLDGLGAAEGHDDERVGYVDCDETCRVCIQRVLKLRQGRSICFLNPGAVSELTGNLCAGRIVVVSTVCGRTVLGEVFEVGKDGGGDRCRRRCVVIGYVVRVDVFEAVDYVVRVDVLEAVDNVVRFDVFEAVGNIAKVKVEGSWRVGRGNG
jgi:hypothetical protein